MKKVLYILIILAVLVTLLIVIGFFLPQNYKISEKIAIDRPVEMVYYKSLDFNERVKWDPWLAQEKDAQTEIDITESGEGSTWTWKGEKIGSGRITVEKVVINEKIESRLEFFEPNPDVSEIIWKFKKAGNGTEAEWIMKGSWKSLMERWIGLFITNSIEKSFKQGLQNFKEYVEKLPELPGETTQMETIRLDSLAALIIRKEVATNKTQTELQMAFRKLMDYFNKQNIEMTQPPFVVFNEFDPDGKTIFEAAFPVNKKMEGDNSIKFKTYPSTKAVSANHIGAYETSYMTYNKIQKYINENGMKIMGPPREIYLTDPRKEMDRSKWKTQIVFPVEK